MWRSVVTFATQAEPIEGSEYTVTTGLVGQNASVDEILTGRQNLVMFGRLYHLSRAAASQRATELLEQFQLTEAADRSVATTPEACVAGSTWRPA